MRADGLGGRRGRRHPRRRARPRLGRCTALHRTGGPRGDVLGAHLVIARAGRVFVLLSDGTAGTEAFTLAGSVLGDDTSRAGDTNGDGAEDVLVLDHAVLGRTKTALHLGRRGSVPCRHLCAARLGRPAHGARTPPDLNGDGFSELFLSEGSGRSALSLSEGSQGAPASTPVWSVLGDPLHPGFGRSVVSLGDVDGDGLGTEFAVTSEGRVDLYFPRRGVSAELRPAWAWSARRNPLSARTPESSPLPVVPAGDLDGDGFDDVLIGLPPRQDTSFPEAGQVVLYAGGGVPAGAETPFLLPPKDCALGYGGKPDLTVDGVLLARSLFVEARDFGADACEVAEGCVAAPGRRRLLRFSVSIPNLGSGEAFIPGPDVAPWLYERDACHGHAHLLGFTHFALQGAQSGLVATGRKQGFNLLDLQPYCLDALAPVERAPDLGISSGWAAISPADLPCQWLDITDVPDGTYALHVAVDPDDLVDEQDVLPNTATLTVRLRGDAVEVVPAPPPLRGVP